MALSRFIEKKFGVKTRGIPRDLTVTTFPAVVQVLKNNPDRLGYVVINLGGFPVYMSFDTIPTATHGILLINNGGFVSMSADEDGEIVGYETHATAIGGNSEIYIVEMEGE